MTKPNEPRTSALRFDERSLESKGFIKSPTGTWHKPATPSLDRLQSRKHSEQAGALEQKPKAKPAAKAGGKKRSTRAPTAKGVRRKRPHLMIVTLTCHVPRYFDSDNATISTKAIRDELAEWLGVDDGDRRILWEVDQTLTRGTPGVCVSIRECR